MIQPGRIGIFGGSFDPPHNGHLICAKSVADQLSLSKVLVIPAAEQPLKPEGATAPAEIRLRMLQALFRDDPQFEISRIELDRGGESFTIDTLRELNRTYSLGGRTFSPLPRRLGFQPDNPGGRTFSPLSHGLASELFLIVGADILAEMPRWKEPDEIFKLARVAVMTRPGVALPTLPAKWERRIVPVATPLIDVSSTSIRRLVREGKDISTQLPKEIEKIISSERLYEGSMR